MFFIKGDLEESFHSFIFVWFKKLFDDCLVEQACLGVVIFRHYILAEKDASCSTDIMFGFYGCNYISKKYINFPLKDLSLRSPLLQSQ